jgi:hypothetical protein
LHGDKETLDPGKILSKLRSMKVEVKYPRMFGAETTKEVAFEVEVKNSNVFNHRLFLEKVYRGFGNIPDEDQWWWPFTENKIRSLSVGDFVSLDGEWWQCVSMGWKKVSERRVKEVMAMPVYDTWRDENLR